MKLHRYTIYIIPAGTKLCRYGKDDYEWINSTREVTYPVEDRLTSQEEVYNAIKPFRRKTELESINMHAFLWFRTPDKDYPVFAVAEEYVTTTERTSTW